MSLIYEVFKGARNSHYTRTVELAKKYKANITGVGLDEYLAQYQRRESPEDFKQRVAITKHINQSVCDAMKKPFAKIPRSNAGHKGMKGEKDAVEKINTIIGKFYGTKTLDEWMATRYMQIVFSDPNAYIVLEWKPFDPTKEHASPYPYEVSSENCLYTVKENGVLKELYAKTDQKQITVYGEFFNSVFTDVSDSPELTRGMEKYDGQKAGVFYMEEEDSYFLVSVFEHNIGQIPAVQVGCILDDLTEGMSVVNPFHAAMPILDKTLKSNSEFDLTNSLHVFPQKLQYVKPCKAPGCVDGHLNNGERCGVCKGTGYEIAGSAQEVITLKLPATKEELIPLQDLLTYVGPPVELLKFQEEYIKSLTGLAKEAVFNSMLYSRQEIAETATGKNIDLQSIYDTLYPVAVQFATVWYDIVNIIAKITQINVEPYFVFGKDFKMKSLSELIGDLKNLKDCGAEPAIVSAVNNDIANILLQDDDLELLKYHTMKKLYPFPGKSEDAILLAISRGLVSRNLQLLWANFEYIIETLFENENFIFLSTNKQKEEAMKMAISMDEGIKEVQ